VSVAAPARFAPSLVARVAASQVVGVRAGRAPHRTIAVWAVVVDGRVFARSWGRKPDGWNATFRRERVGTLEVDGRPRRVRAVLTRSERLLDAVSDAYREKYHTPGAKRWVRDLCKPSCRATTIELVPGAAAR
jgi:hypothetical protein